MTTEHQGLPVAGYRPQTEDKVAIVNENKLIEERLLRRVSALMTAGDESDKQLYDARWLSIARKHFEQGFMAMNRAIFRPERVRLPEDDA